MQNGQLMLRPSLAAVRLLEEKEVLEHFAGVFTMMNPTTFREIFSTTIEYVVDRTYTNHALQVTNYVSFLLAFNLDR